MSASVRRLLSHYKVRFIDPDSLGEEFAALHCLTTKGKRLGIPSDEIWIAKDLREVAPILTLHEAVEHELRRQGWNYADSHAAAVEAELEAFGRTPLYDRARELLADE